LVRTIDAVVSLVLVSHSGPLLVALRQMIDDSVGHSPAVELAGGTDDGRFGTSLRRVSAALTAADSPDGTVVVYDSGSAWLTISFAVDGLAPVHRGRVVVSDAPLVEGALAAAARAAQDAQLAEVLDAAANALRSEKRPSEVTSNGAATDRGAN
jgi:dihydroxyacetone kinase DhaKLM complex PTS-EIIA-like component DhaM